MTIGVFSLLFTRRAFSEMLNDREEMMERTYSKKQCMNPKTPEFFKRDRRRP